jgi:hypothetical protein
LTSDDCEFAYGSSGAIPAKGDAAGLTQECYKNIKSKLTGDVKLAFLYAPFILHQCSYNYLAAISDIDKHVPVFGSLAVAEITKIADETRTLCGGQNYKDRLVMLLLSGNVSPEFYIGSVAKEAALISNVGEVTASHDNYVTEINGLNIGSVFEKIGYKDGVLQDSGIATSVFILNEKDGGGNLIPLAARGLFIIEDGAGIFGGRVPTGSFLSLAINTKDSISANTREIAARIKEEHKSRTVLIYLCLGRLISLLEEPLLELDIISEELAEGFNYIAAYSGGEICPESVSSDTAYNSEHNQVLVACVF